MEQITLWMEETDLERIEEEAEERDESKSKIVRELVQRGYEYDQLESENERLRNQLQATNQRNDVNDKLVRYVENDLDFHEEGIATKLKWFVFGK